MYIKKLKSKTTSLNDTYCICSECFAISLVLVWISLKSDYQEGEVIP